MLSKQQVMQVRDQLISDDELPRIFSVLGDNGRWRLFSLLADYQDLCVSDLAHILDVSVPAVSQQLRMMEMSGVVRKERLGQRICYQINDNNSLVRRVLKLLAVVKKENLLA